MEAGVFLALLSALESLFLQLGCLVQPRYEDFCLSLTVSSFVPFVCCLLEDCFSGGSGSKGEGRSVGAKRYEWRENYSWNAA